MVVQLREDIPAICQNQECENYKAFELYEVEEIFTDTETAKDYVLCYECGQKVYIQK